MDLSYHDGLNGPAVSRYGSTTPALLKWFDGFNRERDYADQVKPFNFSNAFHARPQFELPEDQQQGIAKRGRPREQSDIKPVAPFDRNIGHATKAAVDGETGKAMRATQLMSYVEALAQYHLRPESKFLNGDFSDRGRTERRHVFATQITHIGKEANKREEQHFLGEDEEAEVEYGVTESESLLDGKIRALCEEVGERAAAERTGISRASLRRALKVGIGKMSRSIRSRLAGTH